MNAADEILDRLATWAKSRESGRELTAEELCPDRPELIAKLRSRIAQLESMRWLEEPDATAEYVHVALEGEPRAETEDVLPPELGELSLDEFRRRLENSGLISAERLRAFEQELALDVPPGSARELASELVHRQQLTRHQAREIARGRGQLLVLGNYVVLDKLGQGGMGLVFKARHQRMDRLVALKVLRDHSVESAGAVERFQREVKAAARLTHPNIVTAYDADQSHGTHFLVMELVDGVDLHVLVSRQGSLTYAAAIDCLLQAARGLAYAHEQGIIHRDIKPSNLLIDRRGQVRILDMGLARLTSDENVLPSHGGLTQDGAVLGTVDYMAPEQAASTHTADVRSDIYSLGCTLFFLLTGQPPFSGPTLMARMLAHRDEPIPRLVDLRSDVPRCLAEIVDRCLAKNPADRFPSVAALIDRASACSAACAASISPSDSRLGPLKAPLPTSTPSRETSSILEGDTLTRNRPQGEDSPAHSEKASSSDSAQARVTARPLVLITLAISLAALAALAAVVYRIVTDQGVLVVEIDDGDVAPAFQPRAVVLTNASGRTWTIKPNEPETLHSGRYKLRPLPGFQLHVTDDEGAELETEAFTIRRNKKVIVRVTLEPPPVARRAEGPDFEKAVTLWALRLGCRVEVYVDEQYFELSSVHGLPPQGSFRLQSIDFPLQAPIRDADLGRLVGLKSLRTLGCYDTPLTDAAGPHLAKLTNLEQLSLGKTQVTDALLVHLAKLPKLAHLRLGETEIGDAGLKHLAGCKALQELDLRNSAATPQGIAELRKSLPNCQIAAPE